MTTPQQPPRSRVTISNFAQPLLALAATTAIAPGVGILAQWAIEIWSQIGSPDPTSPLAPASVVFLWPRWGGVICFSAAVSVIAALVLLSRGKAGRTRPLPRDPSAGPTND